jgi:putative phosphoribosyl transferase
MSRAAAFVDRRDAGRQLGERVRARAFERPVVLALPRGGVPVGAEVAVALRAPLDVLLVRKLGVPDQVELAMGAIGEDGVRVLNARVLRVARVSDAEVADVEAGERAELERRVQRYRGDRGRIDLTGRTAILVDDGIATGSTARAACEVARIQGAARVVFAAPVAPPSAIAELRAVADDVIAILTPERFYAIGQFYENFTQTSDDEVVRLLRDQR